MKDRGFTPLQINQYLRKIFKICRGKYIRSKFATGFTLVELLLAAAILVFALAGLLHLFNYCLTLTVQSANIITATAEICSKLEEIRLHDYNTIVSTYNGSTFNLQQLSGTLTVSASYVSGTSSELLQATVAASYTEKGNRIANLAYTTLIAKKF